MFNFPASVSFLRVIIEMAASVEGPSPSLEGDVEYDGDGNDHSSENMSFRHLNDHSSENTSFRYLTFDEW